jgi:hypothetical protein
MEKCKISYFIHMLQRKTKELANFQNQQHGMSEIKESLQWDKEKVVVPDLSKAPMPW